MISRIKFFISHYYISNFDIVQNFPAKKLSNSSILLMGMRFMFFGESFIELILAELGSKVALNLTTLTCLIE